MANSRHSNVAVHTVYYQESRFKISKFGFCFLIILAASKGTAFAKTIRLAIGQTFDFLLVSTRLNQSTRLTTVDGNNSIVLDDSYLSMKNCGVSETGFH